MNRAYCNSCQDLVPANPTRRGDRVFLVKDCPNCGQTETLISGDGQRYENKRSLDEEHEYGPCALNCLECRHRKTPNFLFVDITNRCNLNCPICINNTPSMGFQFEPPMEYFDRLFGQLAGYDSPPAVQLFGGEPTVRDDLFDIIALARSYGLPARVVTNGLKLADEEYCRDLIATRATILIAFDGNNPETYRTLRGSERSLDLKLKALENIRRAGRAKVALMMCVAKGFNDTEMPELMQFLHERRDYIRGVYFMPLAHAWESGALEEEPDRITSEDIEAQVDACFPDTHTEFIPAGVFGQMSTLMDLLGIKPPPFMGAHPNCESLYILVSDGSRYRPLDYYMKDSVHELIRDLCRLEKDICAASGGAKKRWWERLPGGGGLSRKLKATRALLSVLRCTFRHARLGRALKGGLLPAKVWHGLASAVGLLTGRKTRTVLEKHTHIHQMFQLIVLPFEDTHVLETDRLERCPNAFAFLEPDTGLVKTVPVCAWSRHKKEVFRKIADHYSREPAAADV